MALRRFVLIPSLTLVLIMGCTSSVIGNGGNRVCRPITVPMCKTALTYNMSSYPNMYGHETAEETGLEVHQFWPLVEIKCSPYFQEFICALYMPACNLDKITRPCRRLCQAAKKGCAPLMRQYGFAWPERMDCETFPDNEVTPGVCYSGRISDDSTISPIRTTPTPKLCSSVISRHGRELCRHLPYNITSFPNSLGHRNSDEAAADLASTVGTLPTPQCHKSLMAFLCFVYFPVCTEFGTIRPCQHLCVEAKSICGLDDVDSIWPAKLNCDLYPYSQVALCVGNIEESVQGLTTPTPTSSRQHEITTVRASPAPRQKRLSFRKFLALFQKSLGKISEDISSLKTLLTDK